MLEQVLALGRERGGEPLADDEALLRRADRRRHDLRPCDFPAPVLLPRQLHSSERARHIHKNGPIQCLAASAHERAVGERRLFRSARHELDEHGTIHVAHPHEHLSIATETAGIWFNDAQCERDRNGGVHHVTAFAQHLEAGCRCHRMGTRDSGVAGCRITQWWSFAQHVVQHLLQHTVGSSGECARLIRSAHRVPALMAWSGLSEVEGVHALPECREGRGIAEVPID